ncbi:hypothetical protein ACI7YT_03845 [Microbacterium sp. M]|uniref:hypothetical protein n=1 Tax=Microbacterium sp. M TaxID=3377125 RepID=UPI003869B32B
MSTESLPDTVYDAWIATLANLVAVRSPMAAPLYQRLVARDDWPAPQRAKLLSLASWLGANALPGDTPTIGSNEIAFGVMGYLTPDNSQTSRNIGDWVQTMSLMSHLIRRPDVELTGREDLVGAFTSAKQAIPRENQISGPSAQVHLVEFNRDATLYDALPENTWAFVFGWFMKRIYGAGEQIPLHPNLNPVFISFHISHPRFLTAAAVEYLKEHAPVGCRDWHTVRLLTDRGIPAYFSGCVTTTIGSLFPTAEPNPSNPIAYVDVEPPTDAQNVVRLKNLDDRLRKRPLAESLTQAYERIDAYRNDYSEVVTGRLHAFLPAESCGVKVQWEPSDPNDRRFDGLIGTDAPPRHEIRTRISEIVRTVLDGILAGATPEEVRRIHAAEVQSDLEIAAARLASDATLTSSKN